MFGSSGALDAFAVDAGCEINIVHVTKVVMKNALRMVVPLCGDG